MIAKTPFAALLVLIFCCPSWAADAPNIPDPATAALALVPEAAKAGPPPIAKPGTRLVYFGMSASVRGTRNQLVLDPNGNWVNKATGDRYGEQEVPTASGAGFTSFEIGYVDKDVVMIACKSYLLDATQNKTMFTGETGMVTNAGCAGDLWIHPDVLKGMKEVNANGVRILRMPYVVNKKKYNALRIQTETDNGYTAYVYDLDTGLLIFHGSSAQGAGLIAPGVGGKAAVGAGNTQLVSGWLMEVKERDIPWAKAPPPDWVGRFKAIEYRGALTTAVPGAGQLSRPLAAVITPKARGQGWLRTTASVTIQSVGGLPPDQSASEGAIGVGSVGGMWVGPAGLAGLKRGQEIDRNDITRTSTVVSDVNPRTVTITETGQLHRIDWTYDTQSGALVRSAMVQQVGVGQTILQIQLAGQK